MKRGQREKVNFASIVYAATDSITLFKAINRIHLAYYLLTSLHVCLQLKFISVYCVFLILQLLFLRKLENRRTHSFLVIVYRYT